MDTRTKIVSLADAQASAAQAQFRIVTAYCDPLLPNYIDRLRQAAGDKPLLVVLLTPPDAYLEVRARAELAAALTFVAQVVIGDEAAAEALSAEPWHLSEGEARAAFIDLVRNKARS